MKILTFAAFLVVMMIFLSGQETIDNPAGPLNKSAGKVVELDEVLRIKESGDEFFFRFPHNLRISPNGTISIQDQDALYQFDAEGKFLRNLFKKGQGMGETEYISNVLLHEDKIVVHSGNRNKIIWLNDNGSLRRGISLPQELTMSTLRFYEGGEYYFQKLSWPEMRGNEEIKNVPQDLVAFDENSGEVRTIASFPTRSLLVRGGGGRGMIPIDRCLVVL